MQTRKNKYAEMWGFKKNPFVPMASQLDDELRRSVFTGYDHYLNDMLDCLIEAQSCCVFGMYGMGKTFLMLESQAHLREEYPDEVLPVYETALPKQGFEMTVLNALHRTLRGRIADAETDSSFDNAATQIQDARNGKVDPLVVIREFIDYAQSHGLRPAFLIDDIDRVQDVINIKLMIDTARELNSLQCSVVLPSNPANVTRIIRTVGHGIFDEIELEPFSADEFKLMIGRYLETVRKDSKTPKKNLNQNRLIFIWHVSEDKERAQELYNKLRENGYYPWMSLHEILPGEKQAESINDAIEKAAFFIACSSQNSVNKRGKIHEELDQGYDRAKGYLRGDIYFIPVLFDDCELPKEMQDYQAADLRAESGFEKLLEALKEGLKQRGDGLPSVPSPASDSSSMQPFEDESISYILERIGMEAVTPRLIITCCNKLLSLAADEKKETISKDFVEGNWERIGGNILANEGSLDRLIAIINELADKNGHIDEEIDLQSLKRMLDGREGRFVDVVKRIQEVEGFEDIFVIQEEEGMTSVELSPIISPEFIKETLIKMKLDDFRRRYGSDTMLSRV